MSNSLFGNAPRTLALRFSPLLTRPIILIVRINFSLELVDQWKRSSQLDGHRKARLSVSVFGTLIEWIACSPIFLLMPYRQMEVFPGKPRYTCPIPRSGPEHCSEEHPVYQVLADGIYGRDSLFNHFKERNIPSAIKKRNDAAKDPYGPPDCVECVRERIKRGGYQRWP